MTTQYCYGGICFIALDANSPKFFGFSEFLAGLALMVLAWTTADIRYRFRIRVAPLPLQIVTFSVVATVGTFTLLTDLWRAEQWLVPQGNILTPAIWQAILGGLFFLTFLMWAWFAFIRPPIFGKRNAERYAQTLYRFILKGSPTELAVIADEFMHSANSLVNSATNNQGRFHAPGQTETQKQATNSLVEAYANDILLLIADKRFCRAIAESSPGTAWAIFHEMDMAKKYGIRVGTFSKNIVNQALEYKDSFLFHETGVYTSGLIGYQKPLSQAMFGNYWMVESIGTILDPDLWKKRKWDADQWEAYCRIVLITFKDYVDKALGSHSFVLYRALNDIQDSTSDLYVLNGVAKITVEDNTQSKLLVVLDFIKDTIAILDKKDVPKHLPLRARNKPGADSIYDDLASMFFEVIFNASYVQTPRDECWWIQHNLVWSHLFSFETLSGQAGKIIAFKLRRLLYNEITRMNEFPNFKGAKILGYCLNVMGLTLQNGTNDHSYRSLHKAILSWTKKKFVWLHSYNPNVAEACLVDGMTFDAQNQRLVWTNPAVGLRRTTSYVYLDLDPVP